MSNTTWPNVMPCLTRVLYRQVPEYHAAPNATIPSRIHGTLILIATGHLPSDVPADTDTFLLLFKLLSRQVVLFGRIGRQVEDLFMPVGVADSFLVAGDRRFHFTSGDG